MRADDIIGRIGGEEFIAILSGKLPEACIAAERVRAAFEAATLAPDSPQIPATVSIGVACGLPNASIDLLIARADVVLYRAKENGRNRVEPDEDMVTGAVQQPPERRTEVRTAIPTVSALTVPIMVR
jgi:diguanylate cyclase (GGDEF)-like protein